MASLLLPTTAATCCSCSSSSASSFSLLPVDRRRRPIRTSRTAAAAAAATSVGGFGRLSRANDVVQLGKPTVAVEKGQYTYEVETVIDKLSSLPPRGSVARCLDAFRHRLSLADLALVFREFARRGDWQRSLRLFKYMQRQPWCRPDEHIHALLIATLSRHGPALLDKCVDVFSDLDPAARSSLSYTALISAFARNGRHEDALALLSRMKSEGVTPTVLTYNTVLAACARAGLPWDDLLSLFADMRHAGQPNARPDIVTYNTLLAAAAARQLPDQAEMLLRAMLEAGVAPDASSHTYLVSAFASAGRLSRVSQLLAEMVAAGHAPDIAAYNVLIEAHANAGDISQSIAVLRQMQADGCNPAAATYSILLSMYGREGKYDNVGELFHEMKLSGANLDAATYNTLINVYGDGGYFHEVVALFHEMVDGGIEPDMETYEGVVVACGKGGLHKDAHDVLTRLSVKGLVPSVKAYTGVVEAYGQAALYEEAYVAFNTMNEIGSSPTLETYNSLVHSYAQGGLFKEVKIILGRMKEASIQMDGNTYNSLIEAYCQGGQLEDAVKEYVEMHKSGCIPDRRTIEAVLNVYCIAGLVDESKEQFQELQSIENPPSIASYCMLLSSYAKNERWHDVHKLLEEMKASRTSGMHQVIGAMIKGEYDDDSNWQMVEYVFNKYKSEGCGFSLRFYNSLLDALWWLGQRARAVRVLEEATRRGVFPELFRQSGLVWSLDVHRMSVGGSLVALCMWLNQNYIRLKAIKDLPQLASIIVARGALEETRITRGLPIAKAIYNFLKENAPISFSFSGWNKGRIICHRSQLKKLQSATSTSVDDVKAILVALTNAPFPTANSKTGTGNSNNIAKDTLIPNTDLELVS